jgi:hypothetical protein
VDYPPGPRVGEVGERRQGALIDTARLYEYRC